MPGQTRPNADALLDALTEGTAGEIGLPFFKALVGGLVDALGIHGAWVTEYLPQTDRLRAIAFLLGGEWVPHYEYDVRGTPCGAALEKRDLVIFADRVLEVFPEENDLRSMGAVSYMGAPLLDEGGITILGHLGVLDTQPMPDTERYARVFRIFANRAGAELRRLRLERALRATTAELEAVLHSAMDAILILDEEGVIVRANRAAARALGCADPRGEMIDRFLSVSSAEKLDALLLQLENSASAGPEQLWIPGGAEVKPVGGDPFAVEGTLSRFILDDRRYVTVIMRNISDRLAAEARLADLSGQTAYLREEVERHFGEILGDSPAMRRVIEEIGEVAGTDATVLISGETGTGKELVARAVHRASRRADKPLVTVNCAAIPAQLIESEFFGHEKGAFTGATTKRDGRFALANRGTIFLDEIGELPMELQPKLLRVLQEGEFEPVGSSHTRSVDVRVIAATNRDLRKETEAGRFREDLYYRLSVFPIHIPALRNRIADIGHLAHEFARRCAQRDGRRPPVVTGHDIERLCGYAWPGNARELANVIERAMITGDGTRLNLDRALPTGDAVAPPGPSDTRADGRILTEKEFRVLEITNIRRALNAANGRTSGLNGAATLLGIKPSTLRSRIKALGIQR